MKSPIQAAPPAQPELEALLRLLDDDTPEVRAGVAARFARCSGDLSEWLATRGVPLKESQRRVLSQLLGPSRRETLAREWVVPSGGAAAMGEDWDGLEAMLRALSDFLHDGVSLRQPLSDALDLLAEEAAARQVVGEEDLRRFLFVESRFVANESSAADPRNIDLAWALANGRSNALGLGLIFLLTGRRLELEVEGIDCPHHFLCRIVRDGQPWIVDCTDRGRTHLQTDLLADPALGRGEKALLLGPPANPGGLILRVLHELFNIFKQTGRNDDAVLIGRLRASLQPG